MKDRPTLGLVLSIYSKASHSGCYIFLHCLAYNTQKFGFKYGYVFAKQEQQNYSVQQPLIMGFRLGKAINEDMGGVRDSEMMIRLMT